MIKLILILGLIGYVYFWISNKFFDKNKKKTREVLGKIEDTLSYTEKRNGEVKIKVLSFSVDNETEKKEFILSQENGLIARDNGVFINFESFNIPIIDTRRGIFLKGERGDLVPLIDYEKVLPNITKPLVGIPLLTYWKITKERKEVVDSLRKLFLDMMGKTEYPEYRK